MNKENNPLIFREKPYRTREEDILYYTIAIDESLKQGRPDLAAHYKIMLDFIQNESDADNQLLELILAHNKGKKEVIE